jgi:hypothetical protein
VSSGWQPIPAGDEAAIQAAWVAYLQPAGELIIPAPSWTWRGQALARHRERPELEAEFAGKLLAAFRICTRPGERLWVIDWQHGWFYLDPHTASVSERMYPALPDGDSYNTVAMDFRFGVVMGWRETGPVTLFGAELLAAFDADPPPEFLQVCGPGEQSLRVGSL